MSNGNRIRIIIEYGELWFCLCDANRVLRTNLKASKIANEGECILVFFYDAPNKGVNFIKAQAFLRAIYTAKSHKQKRIQEFVNNTIIKALREDSVSLKLEIDGQEYSAWYHLSEVLGCIIQLMYPERDYYVCSAASDIIRRLRSESAKKAHSTLLGSPKRGSYKMVKHPITGEQVMRARVVVEEEDGTFLEPNETVHHCNGDKSDDRIDNLIRLSKKDHYTLHSWLNKIANDREKSWWEFSKAFQLIILRIINDGVISCEELLEIENKRVELERMNESRDSSDTEGWSFLIW